MHLVHTACCIPTILWLAATSSAVPSIVVSDIDSDGRTERVVLDPRNSHALSVSRNGKKLWEGVPAKWKPFKLRVANLDGLRVKSIVLGVFKSTRFFPKPHNCLFVYGWDEKRDEAFERWLGSSLSKPYLDFEFVRFEQDKYETLIAIERLKKNQVCLMAYRWNGFGFDVLWQSKGFARAALANRGTVSLNDVPYRIVRERTGFRLQRMNER
jgi:hypothetical protein